MAGYSGKPLAEKLGIKPGMRVTVLNAPRGYRALLGKLPAGARIAAARTTAQEPRALVHWFVSERRTLEGKFAALARDLAPAGMLWVSWPKRGATVATDLTENLVREVGLATGLVDVKVCAVDETWSGLKFVRRLKDR